MNVYTPPTPISPEEIVRKISNKAVGFLRDRYEVKGLKEWRLVDFNSEHDLCLIFVVLEDGTRGAFEGYGEHQHEEMRLSGKWTSWEELLSEESVASLVDHPRFDYERMPELMAVLRALILD